MEGEPPQEAGAASMPESMKRPVGMRQVRGSAPKKLPDISNEDQAYNSKRHRPGLAVNVREARHGIVLMTILGPCRALSTTAGSDPSRV